MTFISWGFWQSRLVRSLWGGEDGERGFSAILAPEARLFSKVKIRPLVKGYRGLNISHFWPFFLFLKIKKEYAVLACQRVVAFFISPMLIHCPFFITQIYKMIFLDDLGVKLFPVGKKASKQGIWNNREGISYDGAVDKKKRNWVAGSLQTVPGLVASPLVEDITGSLSGAS